MLKRAIESVKKQTFKGWELIVVHDGGEAPVSEEKVKHWALQPHSGSDTRPKNLGIKHAQADLIAFLDDDNTWRPDHLQALYNAQLDTGADVVYGDRFVHNELDPKGNGIGVHREFSSFHLMQRNYIDTSDVLIKKSALQYVGGFDERYRKFVDWNLWIRLDKAGFSFKRVPLVLTDYYLHKGSKGMRKEDEVAPQTPAWNPIDLEIRLPYLGEVKKPRVAIFSLTMDRLEYTKACFESLNKTAGYPFHHFVIDNGSTDGTVKWLEDYEKQGFHMVGANKVNTGISHASNQAIKAITDLGDYDIIGKVDNDCFFLTQDWLKKIIELWETNHKLAFGLYPQGLRDNPGGATREAYGLVKNEYLGLTKHLGGICVFADHKAWEGFRHDEQMTLHSVQDVEFSQHLLKEGYQPAYLENYFIEHYEGTEGQEKRYPEYFERRKIERTTRYEESK